MNLLIANEIFCIVKQRSQLLKTMNKAEHCLVTLVAISKWSSLWFTSLEQTPLIIIIISNLIANYYYYLLK